MPFALLTIGLLICVSGVRNTTGQLSAQVAKDFSGSNSFLYWLAGLGAVGAIGYIDAFRSFSRLLLALIIIVMALSNKGFFAKFQEGIAQAQAPTATTTDMKTGQTAPGAAPATTAAPKQSMFEQLLGLPAGSTSGYGPLSGQLGAGIGFGDLTTPGDDTASQAQADAATAGGG